MKCMTLRGCRLPVVTILVVPAALGCVQAGATPADQLPVVTDAVETASTFQADQILLFLFNLENAVTNAFLRTASIKPEFHRTNTNLDPTGSPNYPDWPDPDDPQSLSWYQIYASNHHDTQNYPWVIFYVNHTVRNSTTSCEYGPAFTYENKAAPNTPWSDRALRFTFVYLTDIEQHEKTLCFPPANNQEFENFVIHVVTHEYGHQRAGLTHNDRGTNTTFYHQGQVPTGRADVMSSNVADARAHTDPVFDARGIEEAGDNSTCRGNLITNRSVQ